MTVKVTKIDREVREQEVAFEKARFEYCFKLYEKEIEHSETLERRSQFFLSFITLILGALFLNLDFFEKVKNIVINGITSQFVIYTLYFSTIILALSLLVSILSILEFNRLRVYIRKYPENIITALFSPDSNYLPEKTEKGLFYATAMSYAIALEFNAKITDQRAKWVQVSSISTFFVALSLFVILGIVAFLLVV